MENDKDKNLESTATEVEASTGVENKVASSGDETKGRSRKRPTSTKAEKTAEKPEGKKATKSEGKKATILPFSKKKNTEQNNEQPKASETQATSSQDTEQAAAPESTSKPSKRALKSFKLTNTDVKEIQLGPSVLSWFITLMIGSIPVMNIVYYFLLALFSQSAKRRYAIAWLLANFIFFVITVVIVLSVMDVGVLYLDKILEYMEML